MENLLGKWRTNNWKISFDQELGLDPSEIHINIQGESICPVDSDFRIQNKYWVF